MLVELYVKDFALIEEIRIEFSSQFNVLSGETGAGKSIIIDAVSLLLGSRASANDIRRGCEKAIVEGVFDVDDELLQLLKNVGIEQDKDEMLILRREIIQNGKNICRINNITVNLATFKEIGSQLVNIYGQHDYQEITKQENHLKLLDSLGDDTHQTQCKTVRECYQNLQLCGRNLKKMMAKEKDKKDRMELLQKKSKELALLPKDCVEEEMEQELKQITDASLLRENINLAENILYQDGESIYNRLSQVKQVLSAVSEYSIQMQQLYQRLESAVYEIEDISASIAQISNTVGENEDRKNELEEKLYLIQRLKRRYGMSMEELLSEKAKVDNELQELENLDQSLKEIKQEYTKLKNEFIAQGQILREKRKNLADSFSTLLVKELEDLAMPHCKFTVSFTEELSADGLDKGEFLFTANKGEDLKPLRTIASGGEMSRIMLAFKKILANKNNYGALIFDEIDTGIGGNVVVKVAQKLKDVSQNAQVICVTHAPQIASIADHHYLISKKETDERTVSNIVQLNKEERIIEIARMLGGSEEYQIAAAKEMMK